MKKFLADTPFEPKLPSRKVPHIARNFHVYELVDIIQKTIARFLESVLRQEVLEDQPDFLIAKPPGGTRGWTVCDRKKKEI